MRVDRPVFIFNGTWTNKHGTTVQIVQSSNPPASVRTVQHDGITVASYKLSSPSTYTTRMSCAKTADNEKAARIHTCRSSSVDLLILATVELQRLESCAVAQHQHEVLVVVFHADITSRRIRRENGNFRTTV